jgi:hypothetical protein
MGPFTLIRGSVYAVYTVLYCAALLIVSEYRGDLVYKNSAMRADLCVPRSGNVGKILCVNRRFI